MAFVRFSFDIDDAFFLLQNTYSTATAIGEKAALIIAEELGGSL